MPTSLNPRRCKKAQLSQWLDNEILEVLVEMFDALGCGYFLRKRFRRFRSCILEMYINHIHSLPDHLVMRGYEMWVSKQILRKRRPIPLAHLLDQVCR